MESTNTFIKEHYLIEQVLNCLEKMVERCESQHMLESEPARDAIRFLRGFAERCHYAKEKAQLLPTMHTMGISPQQCLGCSMSQRHKDGLSHVDAMALALEPASAGEATALKEFVKHARAYIELLLEYIARQEDCLFPMIAQRLASADQVQSMSPMERSCNDDECAYETYVELAHHLAEHFGVPKVEDG